MKAPNDAQFVCLWHSRTENHPLQVFSVHGVDPLNLLERAVFTHKALYCVPSSKKHGTCSVSNLLQWRTRNGSTTQHGCDLCSSAVHCQFSYSTYTLCFQALWSSGSENYNIKCIYQKTTVSNACHEKKLKVKKNFFLCYYSKSLVMKVGTCGYWSKNIQYSEFCCWNNHSFV